MQVPGELRPNGRLGHRDADTSGLAGRIPRAKPRRPRGMSAGDGGPACEGRSSASKARLPRAGAGFPRAGGARTRALPSRPRLKRCCVPSEEEAGQGQLEERQQGPVGVPAAEVGVQPPAAEVRGSGVHQRRGACCVQRPLGYCLRQVTATYGRPRAPSPCSPPWAPLCPNGMGSFLALGSFSGRKM